MRKPKEALTSNMTYGRPIFNVDEERKRNEKNNKRKRKQYLDLAIKISLCGVSVYYILKKLKK